MENQETHESKSRSKEQEKESKGVDSVTDYVTEKDSADADKAQAAVGAMSSSATAPTTTAITIKEEDIKFLLDECEISREATESLLRANDGDLKRAIQAYIKSPVPIL